MQRTPPAMGLVWFFCLGGLGMFFPYYGMYLYENAALPGSQVGAVLSILPLVGTLAQPFWGQVGDRTGSRTRVLTWLGLGAAAGYLGLSRAEGFAQLALATGALAFFSSALIPSTVAVTLALTRQASRHAFGLTRVWGTVGFLLLVLAFPPLLDAIQEARGLHAVPGGPSEPALGLMFPATALLVAISGLVALRLPRRGAVALRAQRGDWRQLLSNGPFVRLLLFALVAYLCLQGPMALFSIYVRAHGGSLDSVSRMWIPMLLLEIPLIALSGASLQRIGARGLLAVGVLAGGARWTVLGFAPSLAWVYPAQLLHGVVVAGLVVGGPLYVESVVPEHLRSTAQGLLGMIGVSVGGISSNLGAGFLLEHVGPDAPYVVGGLGALLLGCLVPLVLPAPRGSVVSPETR